MNKIPSNIEEALDIAGLGEVAYRRTELEGGLGEIWDITLPDEQTTIRVGDDDGLVFLYVFTGGGAQIDSGKMTFRHNMAAPTYVAMMLEQLVADYS